MNTEKDNSNDDWVMPEYMRAGLVEEMFVELAQWDRLSAELIAREASNEEEF